MWRTPVTNLTQARLMTVAMTNLCRVGNLKGFWKTNQGKKKMKLHLKHFQTTVSWKSMQSKHRYVWKCSSACVFICRHVSNVMAVYQEAASSPLNNAPHAFVLLPTDRDIQLLFRRAQPPAITPFLPPPPSWTLNPTTYSPWLLAAVRCALMKGHMTRSY